MHGGVGGGGREANPYPDCQRSARGPAAAPLPGESRASLFRGGAIGPQLLQGDRGKAVRQRLQVGGQTAEGGGALEAPLVHVKRAVELELDGMQAGGRIAVMLGDEAAG